MPAAKQQQLELTKQEAAARLQVSTRQLDRMAASGKLSKRLLPPGPGRKVSQTLYLKADVEAIAEERATGIRTSGVSFEQALRNASAAAPQTLPVLAGGSGSQFAATRSQADAWGALATRLMAPSPPPPPRAWLTLPEGSAYSGLPENTLAALLREGTIHSLGRGPKTWRVQRASLDAYGAAAHQ